MKSYTEIERRTKIIIVMDEEEASWLRGYVQDSVFGPDDEPSIDKQMRDKFFNAAGGDNA